MISRLRHDGHHATIVRLAQPALDYDIGVLVRTTRAAQGLGAMCTGPAVEQLAIELGDGQ